MSNIWIRSCALALVGVSGMGCSALSGAKADDHFTCAALIGAATQIVASGQAASDPDLLKSGLVAAMSHLNAWAIPAGLPETNAFDQVKAERDRLAASLPAPEVVSRAKACIASAPRT